MDHHGPPVLATHCCICEVNSMVWGSFSDPMMGLKEGRSERQEMKQVRNAREEGWGRSGKKVERKGMLNVSIHTLTTNTLYQ